MAQDKRGDATQANTSVVPTAPPRWQDSVQLRRFGLEVVDGPDKGATVTAEGERCTVGSHPSNDLVLKGDPTVSRFHCELRSTEEGVRIQDMGSSNGTVVDGLRVEDAWLRDGSQIVIGSSSLLFRIGSESVRIDMSGTDGFGELVGRSLPMRRVFGMLSRCAKSEVTVLIEGETGTGKELVASAVHYWSNRREKLFVAQNCAAMPENLLESELFGHKKGSFTGATDDKKGLFELAHEGTLFLDEVGEMPLQLQAKLLRVLQEGEIRPVGSNRTKKVDTRIVAATNRNLEKEVEEGRFREDLYYRLKVFPIRLPPLRERKEDIPLLAGHFLTRYSEEFGMSVRGFSQQAMEALQSYAWPGNVRELENEVQRLVIQVEADQFIQPQHLSPRIKQAEGLIDRARPKKGTLKEMMETIEKQLLREALAEHDNNKTRTAATLGITREGLHKKLKNYGMT